MRDKVYQDVISGKSDYNINFSDFRNLISDLGFDFLRQKGSHIMYYHADIGEFINIQKDNSKAKGYEVKQLRDIIKKYNL